MNSKLNFPDVLKEFGETVDPHALGVYFRVGPAVQKKIDSEAYRGDYKRQLSEVIQNLLLDHSLEPELLCKTLTQAAEKIASAGGHAPLINSLSSEMAAILNEQAENQKRIAMSRAERENRPSKGSSVILLDSSIKRNILILGKNSSGKSTLGNRILKCNHFKINGTPDLPQTQTGELLVQSESELKNYQLKVYDHDGLFDSEVDTSTAMSSFFTVYDELQFNIVFFVMKQGHCFSAHEQRTL